MTGNIYAEEGHSPGQKSQGIGDPQLMTIRDLLLIGLCHSHIFIFNFALLVCESNLIEVIMYIVKLIYI